MDCIGTHDTGSWNASSFLDVSGAKLEDTPTVAGPGWVLNVLYSYQLQHAFPGSRRFNESSVDLWSAGSSTTKYACWGVPLIFARALTTEMDYARGSGASSIERDV